MKIRVPFAPRRGVAVLALSLGAVPAAQSQTTLGETVVTATRTETRADELVSEVQVIDRAAIEAATARTLPELLAREAGVQFASNGGLGQLSSVFIRGTQSRHTILLVDGVRLGSATSGGPVWETLPLEMIDRIEVLKGPASALYGSDGAGGVVQIFTRKGQAGFHPHASLSAGSFGHAQASAGASGGEGAWRYAFSAQRTVQEGFNATNPNAPYGNHNPDRDPFRQNAANGSLQYQINRDWQLDGSLLASDAVAHFDDGAGRDARSTLRAFVGQLGVSGKVSPDWKTELRLSEGVDTNRPIEAQYMELYKTAQTQVTWLNTVNTRLGAVLAGLEQRQQKVTSGTNYDVKERTIDSAFVGLNGQQGAHSWQVNARHDRNTQFGRADTGFAGYGLRLSPAWRVHASYGTSFVIPSFNDLYYPGWNNPALRPERGRNSDLGIAWTQGAHEVNLVHFDNRIRGFITSGTSPQNIPRTRIDGWTLGYSGKVDRLTVRATYEAMDPRNLQTGKLLDRRAQRQATAGADWRQGAWRFGASVLYVGDRFDDTSNTKPLDAYTVVDLYATWQFARDTSVQFKLLNATDKRYETAYGYNQPGRSAFVTLRWQPK